MSGTSSPKTLRTLFLVLCILTVSSHLTAQNSTSTYPLPVPQVSAPSPALSSAARKTADAVIAIRVGNGIRVHPRTGPKAAGMVRAITPTGFAIYNTATMRDETFSYEEVKSVKSGYPTQTPGKVANKVGNGAIIAVVVTAAVVTITLTVLLLTRFHID